MDLLERAWDGVGNFMGSLMHGFERSVTSVFGTSNARYIRKLQTRVEAINALEERYQAMSDVELRAQTVKFRERLKAGETLDGEGGAEVNLAEEDAMAAKPSNLWSSCSSRSACLAASNRCTSW